MKKLFLTLVCLVASLTTWAYAFIDDNGICYDYSDYYDDATGYYVNGVAVTYYSSENDYVENADHYVGDIVIPEKVEYNGTEYSVIRINSYTFYKCNKITSVSLPNTIRSIDSEAFRNCSKLTSITIPEGVTNIPWGCFCGCI